jgi:hypothetical protein
MTALKKPLDRPLFEMDLSKNIAWQRIFLPVVLFAILLTRSYALQAVYDLPDVVDDSFYYIVVARNIVETGLSTFDGVSLTNGYHPLWMMILIGWIHLFGDAILPIKILEGSILAISLFALLRIMDTRRVLFDVAIFGFFFYAVHASSYMGMEATILFLVYTLTIGALFSDKPFIASHRGIVAGLAAAFCIAARIDAAVFITPLLLVTLSSNRERLWSLGVIAVLGAFYAAVNYVIFGTPLPVSGEIKSLGGLQINGIMIEQLLESTIKSTVGGNYLTVILSYIAVLPVLLHPAVRPKVKLAIAALVLGFVISNIKLLFFSSWGIWGWYHYPIYLILVPGLFALQDIVRPNPLRNGTPISDTGRFSAATVVLGAMALTLGIMYPIYRTVGFSERHITQSFHDVNRQAAIRFADVIGNQLVAMGDRAGSFAYYHKGPVFQLEGLVNDKAYVDVLRTTGDATGYLCRHNVKFVVDYEPDLGNYTTHKLEVLRRKLADYDGPTIEVSKDAEVGRYADLSLYDNSTIGDGDNYVYVWRLACSS